MGGSLMEDAKTPVGYDYDVEVTQGRLGQVGPDSDAAAGAVERGRRQSPGRMGAGWREVGLGVIVNLALLAQALAAAGFALTSPRLNND